MATIEQQVETVTTTMEIKVPVRDWIDYLTKGTDIFLRAYCGYWMLGVKLHPDRGWLVFEDPDGKYTNKKEPGHDAAVEAWEKGDALPRRWHKLDKETAIKAFVEGVRLWGVDWFEKNGDGNSYDHVVQLAMLGERRYS